MIFEVPHAGDIKKRVENPAIREIDLGRLDLPLADVLVPWLKLGDNQRRSERIEIVPDGRVRDAERAGKFRGIPDLAVIMGQHRPKPAQSRRPDIDAELGQISFQECPNEAASPFIARGGRSSQISPGKSSSQP